MKRRTPEPETPAAAPPAPVIPAKVDAAEPSTPAQVPVGPHSREEAEARYIAARDAWLQAMRGASSGRPADLASLALTQETYETAAAERERWIARGRSGRAKEPPRGIEAAVGQEMAWRRVKQREKREGFLGRLKRRITGQRR